MKCRSVEIEEATKFYGINFEMGLKYELRSKPELFRTELN